MKRSASAVWTLLAVVVIGLFLLIDPFGWFRGARVETSVVGPEASVPAPADTTAAELGSGAEVPDPDHDVAIAREAIDPLAAAGIAAFRVLHWTGHVVPDAQVLIFRGEELRCNQHTDEQGVVEVAADGEPAGLVVAVVNRPLEWHAVELTAGRHDVVLTEGGRLSGRFVTENGGSPGKLRLSLDSDHPPTSIPPLPAVVDEAVRARTLRAAYAIFDTDEEGAFDLTGLPAEWSGRIWVRGGWKVLSTTHGETEPSAAGVRFAAPVSDVVVRLARRRALYGRLVLRDDGSPLEGARLVAMLRSPQAKSPTYSSAKTDDEGRFSFESKQDLISEFELRLGQRFRESAPLLRLDEENLPADGDLGDVVVDDVRHVPFLLQDSEGDPVRSGVAIAAGVRSDRTGKDGRGELRWIARAVDLLVAEARGFVPTAHEIPPVVVDALIVTMERANTLVVKLMLPEDCDPKQFKVVVLGEGTITAGPVRGDRNQRAHVALWALPPTKLYSAPTDTFLCAHPDPQTNTATFYALRPGMDLELEIHGITGFMIYHSETLAPFAPEEHREVEVSLETGMITFRGRVLDEDGNPLVRAVVQLGGQILAFTDDDGGFESFLVAPESGTLLLQHRTCTTKYLHDYTVPIDGRPVEFRLLPARPLTIEVVDENGAPMPQADVYTEYGGFTTGTHRIEGHRHYSASMPEGPFVIRADLAGRVYRQEHDPFVNEARVVVPIHGRVVGLVATDSTAVRAGRFVLVLQPQDAADDVSPVTESRDAAPDVRIEMLVVHPGSYEATLNYEPSEAEQVAGLAQSSSASVTIVVVAGEETEVRLALSAVDD